MIIEDGKGSFDLSGSEGGSGTIEREAPELEEREVEKKGSNLI